jgi:hypothetical protein
MDGNKVGVHLWLSQAALLSRDPHRPALQLTAESYAIANSDYQERLDELVARGLLLAGGYWEKRLRAGAVLRQDGTTSLWTGLLVKPAAGVWLLATGSYNRRALVNVRETVITDEPGYTPLMVEFDLASMSSDTMWLEAELACLVPLRPGVKFHRQTLRQRPELGSAHNQFFTDRYFELRAQGKVTGQYRKLAAGARSAPTPAGAQCELVHVAGPDLHTIETFERVVGPRGPALKETAAALPFAVLRNFTPLEFDFDGLKAHLNNPDTATYGAELLAVWRELYGESCLGPVDWWESYFLANNLPPIGEPVVLITPYAFIDTPPGWSVLADSVHYPGMDGLRGVVATDLFHHVGPVFQFRRPGDFRLEVGDPLIRLLPIPRELLDAPYEQVVMPR